MQPAAPVPGSTVSDDASSPTGCTPGDGQALCLSIPSGGRGSPVFQHQYVGVDDTYTLRMLSSNEAEYLVRIGRSAQQFLQERRVLIVPHVQNVEGASNRSALAFGLIVQDTESKSHVIRACPAQDTAGFRSGLSYGIPGLVLRYKSHV